jgi:hypothetical protein
MPVSAHDVECFYAESRVHFFRYFQCCFKAYPELCSDLTQDLFLSLLKNMNRINKLEKYAWGAAHNLVAWRTREKKRHERLMHQYIAEAML